MKDLELEDLVDLDELREAITDADLAAPGPALSWAVSSLSEVEPVGGTLPLIEGRIEVTEQPSETTAGSFRYARPRHRDILVTADGIAVDISVDPPSAGHDLVVVGRLQPDRSAAGGLEGAPVHLLRDGRLAASTLTNLFGDFHIETTTGDEVELVVVLRERGQLRVPLFGG